MMPSEEERALAALLRAGRADPSHDDLKRLEQRLTPWLSSSPVRAADGGRGWALKTILLLVGFGLVVPSESSRIDHATRSGSSPLAVSDVSVAPSKPVGAAEGLDTPSSAPSIEGDVPGTLSVSDLPNAAPVSATKAAPGSSKPNVGRIGATAETPPAKTDSDTGNAAGTRTTEASRPDRDESEASFLRRAQTALNRNPALALQMLQEHSSRFPHGILVQERDVLIIDSLARLGRIDEARARAKAFAAQYPRSAHESRIASILKEGTP